MVLINLALMPWTDAMKKRNQAIFTHLLADTTLFEKGLYVNPPLTLMDHKRWPKGPRIVNRSAGSKSFISIQPVQPLPFSYQPGIRDALAYGWARYLRSRAGGPYTLWINNVEGHAFYFAKALLASAARSVLDLSDDFTTFTDDPEQIRNRISELAAMTDKVLTVNEHVAGSLQHPDKKVFRNGTDYDLFQTRNPAYTNAPYWPKPAGSRYIGFSGGLSRGKTDVALLEKLFLAFPADTFLFVGTVDDPSLQEQIDAYPNAHCVPAVPYPDLPNVIRSFDVAIIPHQLNERTKGNDLLKLMDYLASGVPVVATPCSGLDQYSQLVRLANTHEQFVEAVRDVLSSTTPHDPEPGKNLARSRSWKATVPQLAAWLTSLAPSDNESLRSNLAR